MSRTVSIGGAQGFYGDAVEGVSALTHSCDYLLLDGLAELTLAILQKDRQRNEAEGYVKDLGAHADAFLSGIAEGGAKVITNAGGLNPIAAGRLVATMARDRGIDVKIATVVGDDVRTLLPQMMDEVPRDVRFANAYLGARPIVEALQAGADIVIAGRIADSALALGPLVFEHSWAWDDWDRLAAGTMAGHLIECSGQATGGNLSWKWWESPTPWMLPFPIASVDDAGVTTLTKTVGSGGMVTVETVREQLFYEVHDPFAYVVPDVTADLGNAHLEQTGVDEVQLSGVKGLPAPRDYRALVCSPVGWTGDISIGLGWPDAPAKARAMANVIQRRAQESGISVERWATEIWGCDALLPNPGNGIDPSEVVLRVAWQCNNRQEAERVGRLVPPLYTSGPVPGMTTAARSFRFDASELFSTEVAYIEKALVDANVRVGIATVNAS